MQERLQKLIANAGMASRREAEQWILEGLVTVNGQIVTELGVKADPSVDHIKVKGKLLNPIIAGKEPVYYLINKPKGYLSSRSDPQSRPLVTDLLPRDAPRVYPVGRLDFNTEGIIILTNDGELTNLITKAGAHCPKVYHVKVKGSPKEEQINRLRRGIKIEDDYYRIANLVKMDVTDYHNTWFEVTLHEGKNNQIRKMFDEIGHSVVKLRRVAIGHVTDAGLPVGGVRLLSVHEVQRFFKAAARASCPAAPSKTAGKPAAQTTGTTVKPTLGKPKPTGKAKLEQRKRFAKTLAKDPVIKAAARKRAAKKTAAPKKRPAGR
jgi:23S rRNA pseudouridine2605 synthase